MSARLLTLCFALAAAAMAAPDTKSFFSGIGKEIQKDVVAVATPIEETVVGIGSSQCTNVKKLLGVAYEQIEGEKEPDLNTFTLEYRDSSIRVVYNMSTVAQRLVQSKDFDPTRKLIIFIHGFTDDPSGSSFSNISDSLLSTGECNVLAVDGSSLIHWLYLRSTSYVRFMGERLGETLTAMVNAGLAPANIHIIGHSLGAHISGFTGKHFTNLTGLKVGRISGLDPAGPCFSHVDSGLRLKATDADFVDVVHTDAGVYGLKDPVGQVDYYPNKGKEQPNCLYQSCSHSRAWMYYTESVVNKTAFPAVKCKDWAAFKKGQCDRDVSYMGYPSEPGTKGIYYLQTGDKSPFGLGRNGTKYKNNEGIVKNLGHKAKELFG